MYAGQGCVRMGGTISSTAMLKYRSSTYGDKAEYRILPVDETLTARALSDPPDECRLFSQCGNISIDFYTPELASRLRKRHAELVAPQREAAPEPAVRAPTGIKARLHDMCSVM